MMDDLFAPNPTDNLLPYDGQLYDLGLLDIEHNLYNDNDLYQTLLTTLPWQSDVVTLFGKTHITKRQIVWMGDEGLSYRYAGHTHLAAGWHPIVFHVKQMIEDKIHRLNLNAAGYSNLTGDAYKNYIIEEKRPHFNACLLNYYPSGSEGMGYHADDEKELGAQPLIASLSLGATRKMLFKHKKTQDRVDLYLASGQLVVMAGVTQEYWKHSIAKTKKVHNGRISLTFRRMFTL
ncbi:alpha-ketoglutarate-dependent dioxygenase AlkB family protein [Psychrobacter frigidicola]|uniref:alpha-ketoglutarate-dependent dioxygenase AlkB family protein n=1 Tax=Psychrobacter frigidicola TaxID=45611 RepID=UPI00191915AC|nr:alpha-ketoglutarate-dependent dioxygenase AlkB [Psychrobacter frigidicola]